MNTRRFACYILLACAAGMGGSPALKNQTGVAVYQDGTWKVGASSFCGLLTVENGGKKSSLPAPCKSAG